MPPGVFELNPRNLSAASRAGAARACQQSLCLWQDIAFTSPASEHHSSQGSSSWGKAGILLVLLLWPNCRAAPFEALHATWNRNTEQWHPLEMAPKTAALGSETHPSHIPWTPTRCAPSRAGELTHLQQGSRLGCKADSKRSSQICFIIHQLLQMSKPA